jgi:L-fucose isomerase-like protein
MKTTAAIFVSSRYWDDNTLLEKALEEGKTALSAFADRVETVLDDNELTATKESDDDVLVVVPFSGAVQASVLRAAGKFDHVCIYAAYIQGVFSSWLSETMLANNAAPTVMDSFAVTKRSNPQAKLAISQKEVDDFIKIRRAHDTVAHAKVLLLGAIEPWVVSADRDLDIYRKRFGTELEVVEQKEVAALFEQTGEDDQQVKAIYRHFMGKSNDTLVEPTEQDVVQAARLAAALLKLLADHEAQGIAVACFDLIPLLETTSCLGLSYINDCTDMVASCEGDVDSLFTMLMMRQFAKDKLWMANPNLQADRTVNFAHCTAPIGLCNGSCDCRLRNHHESGKGVSPEVSLPIGKKLTLFRFGNEGKSVTINRGLGIEGTREKTCRTQLHVRLESFDHYIETTLGTHQVIAFEDISEELASLSRLFGLEVL